MARKIALNPDLSMRLLEYCQKKRDDKDSQGELRTYQLYKKFFKNVQSFLLDEKLEVVDMTTFMDTDRRVCRRRQANRREG